MADISIVNWVYKPTYNYGAPPCTHVKLCEPVHWFPQSGEILEICALELEVSGPLLCLKSSQHTCHCPAYYKFNSVIMYYELNCLYMS